MQWNILLLVVWSHLVVVLIWSADYRSGTLLTSLDTTVTSDEDDSHQNQDTDDHACHSPSIFPESTTVLLSLISTTVLLIIAHTLVRGAEKATKVGGIAPLVLFIFIIVTDLRQISTSSVAGSTLPSRRTIYCS